MQKPRLALRVLCHPFEVGTSEGRLHPAVSYSFCSLGHTVEIPVYIPVRGWSLGLMSTKGRFLLQLSMFEEAEVAMGTLFSKQFDWTAVSPIS